MSNETRLQLVDYTRTFLDLSWDWLNDPEIRSLTMTPEFTRQDQINFYESIPTRAGYDIWGVALAGEPIGAAGLKNQRASIAEYWGYIGRREFWGRGLGRSLVLGVEAKARDLGFTALDLKVSTHNLRAISLYRRMGYVLASETSENEILIMMKKIL